ncbi:MAG: LysR family transcriptional regulator [Ekhidna sp.]|nr:LysR family transcriptional regulator [Ekhidna sp.]
MHYTIHQLKVFQSICRNKSITKASEELYLTQPAVSIQLKKLQEQFEIPLTEVVGRQLYITDFGEKIREVSERILSEAEALKTTVDQYKGLLSGKISISVVSTGKYVIPYFLKQFADAHPQVDLRIDVTNKNSVVQSLSKNETDFSLVSVVPENLAVEGLELMDNELYLISDADRKVKKKILQPKDLSEFPMILRESGSATRMLMERFLDKKEIKPKKTMELMSNEAVKQAVSAGLGISIMPLIGLRNELKVGSLKVLEVKGLPIVTKWNLIYPKGKRLSPAAEELLLFITTHKEEIVQEHFSWAKYERKGVV